MTFRNNPSRQRFEWEEQGHVAFADYHGENDVLALPHVEAPPALRGTGVAGKLMQGIVDYARTNGLKLHPVCSYAVAWLHKHKDAHDLLV